MLTTVLKVEVKLVDVVADLVCDKKVYRRHQKCTESVDAKLRKVWDEYCAGTRFVRSVLSACGDIYVSTIRSTLSVNQYTYRSHIQNNVHNLFICILNIVGLYILKLCVDCPIALA